MDFNCKPILKLENPCPMILNRLTGDGEFYCKSCSKTIIDFRDRSDNEIIQQISNKEICGIFKETQVMIPFFSFKNNILFTLLTILAFLGFNVRPIYAQTRPVTKNDSLDTEK